MKSRNPLAWIASVLGHARFGITTVGLAYVIGPLTGLFPVEADDGLTFRFRDRLISDARHDSTILSPSQRGNRIGAVSLDATANALQD
jgi:hypothetical protein